MGMLIAGVLIWSVVHLMKSVTPGLRSAIIAKTGAGPHQGIVALLLVGALALMIFGWRSITPEFVYDAPSWGRHLNMLLMLIAVWLFGASNMQSRIKRIIAHPMLTGMLIWAAGHLLANGDNRSLVLFGGLGLWALISLFTVSRRDGHKTVLVEPVGWGKEILGVVIAVIIYAVLFGAHRWFAGVALVGG